MVFYLTQVLYMPVLQSLGSFWKRFVSSLLDVCGKLANVNILKLDRNYTIKLCQFFISPRLSLMCISMVYGLTLYGISKIPPQESS